MAPRPKPSKVTEAALGAPLVLYVKPAEVAAFIGTVTPDAGGNMVEETQTVSGHSRRRYVGGPSIGVAGHSRARTSGDRLQQLTLPGKNAWLERRTGTPPVTMTEQITYVGTFAQLKQYCKENAVTDFVLRSPWGEPFAIAEDTP